MKTYWVEPKNILTTDEVELDVEYEEMVPMLVAKLQIKLLKRQVAQYEDMLNKLPKTLPNENRPEE